jgi:hypothetical protein
MEMEIVATFGRPQEMEIVACRPGPQMMKIVAMFGRPSEMDIVSCRPGPQMMKIVATFGSPHEMESPQEMEIVPCRPQENEIVACRPSPMPTCPDEEPEKNGGLVQILWSDKPAA